MKDRLIAGKLLKPNGLGGFIGVQTYADDPARFHHLKQVWLVDAEGIFLRELTLDGVKLAPGKTFLHFAGINQREEAALLSGAFISIARDEAQPLEENSWYGADLLGCQVFDEHCGLLGTVSDILPGSSQDVLEISKAGEPALYFPFLKTNLKDVDLSSRTIRVLLPDGLYELYRG